MNAQGTERTEKRLCVGLLAHVDAGKTTLSEAMLYRAGVIRTLGRVDHGDTFLDTDAQERSRGITIFSKQAVLPLPGCTLTLLDTPGHVDFSAEMERALQVLDCAVLIISGPSGIQSHTVTLWRLLRRYQVPVILFFNKMDMETADRDALLAAVRAELDEGCIDFSQPQAQLYEVRRSADGGVSRLRHAFRRADRAARLAQAGVPVPVRLRAAADGRGRASGRAGPVRGRACAGRGVRRARIQDRTR